MPPPNGGQSRQRRPPSRQGSGPPQVRNVRALLCRVLETVASHLRHAGSLLFFAARSEASVSPPPTLMRLSDNRMPLVGIGARFELSVREFTPIQEISDDSRPYSIFGQRFITTLMPAAASSRAPSCIQITFGSGDNFSASSTTGMMWLELRKMSIMPMGRSMSA